MPPAERLTPSSDRASSRPPAALRSAVGLRCGGKAAGRALAVPAQAVFYTLLRSLPSRRACPSLRCVATRCRSKPRADSRVSVPTAPGGQPSPSATMATTYLRHNATMPSCSVKFAKVSIQAAALQQRWSSGRIRPCHGRDPGSIPGRCICSKMVSFWLGRSAAPLFLPLVPKPARLLVAKTQLHNKMNMQGWPSGLRRCVQVAVSP